VDATLSDDEQLLADSAARVAGDLRKAVGPDGSLDPATAWGALDASGLVAMRGEADPAGRASALDVALCVEAFGRQTSPAPLVGPLLAIELLALAGVESPGRATIALTGDLADIAGLGIAGLGIAGPGTGDPSTAHGVAFDALGAAVAVGIGVGAAGMVPVLGALPASGGASISADLTRTVVPVAGFVPGAVGGAAALGPDDLDRWRAFALTTVCADMVGVMAGALAMAVAYAGERRQFGRPIGSFQAIAHLCAEQQVSVEASRSVTYWSAWSVDAVAPAEALYAATVAKAYVARVARPVVEAVLQVYGGIGQTWECEAHRYLRRVLVDRAILGDERAHEAAVAHRALTAAS
jgi:alkylation response protein AidB-like acyl-CoA dehydrogenase